MGPVQPVEDPRIKIGAEMSTGFAVQVWSPHACDSGKLASDHRLIVHP